MNEYPPHSDEGMAWKKEILLYKTHKEYIIDAMFGDRFQKEEIVSCS